MDLSLHRSPPSLKISESVRESRRRTILARYRRDDHLTAREIFSAILIDTDRVEPSEQKKEKRIYDCGIVVKRKLHSNKRSVMLKNNAGVK